ncbi:hypothetical protein K1719_036890 [Acacia pycnantha]|nr:hypothetical protein K1719_036890 [Acacia pycnantha]
MDISQENMNDIKEQDVVRTEESKGHNLDQLLTGCNYKAKTTDFNLSNQGSISLNLFANGEKAKVEKDQKTHSVKVEKTDRSGTPNFEYGKELVSAVRSEKVVSPANFKVERIARDEKPASGVKKASSSEKDIKFDESETVNWIAVRTKPWPKCHKPVEKNGCCNLVSCIYGQAFCWLCGGATGREHTWSSIAVRVSETSSDLLRAPSYIGAVGTPYHDALFYFDIALTPNYPNEPPKVHYLSYGHWVNPNLYSNDTICLSLLNTWKGDPSEHWNPKQSILLQVLLSIQSLVLNEKPYYNEPGTVCCWDKL